MGDNKPCCAADALRRVRQMKINGMMTGITMIDENIEEVMSQDLGVRPGDPRCIDAKDQNFQLRPEER